MWSIRSNAASTPVDTSVPAVIPDQPADTALERRLGLKVSIHRALLDKINLAALDQLPRAQIESEIREIVQELLIERSEVLNSGERNELVIEVLDELLGLGPLEPLLEDETITDILVNGYLTVFVERNGLLERVATRFQDEKHLIRIIQKIVSAVGRRIDESSPFVDARLADGSRVNAIIAPLAIDGSLLSIRKFAKKRIGIEKLVQFGSVPEQMAQVMHAMVK
ncbi:MAG: ATPase, T2SS/T4P/T4SS family, partial [Tsuneonella sp.]